MTKEIKNILQSFYKATKEGKRTALVTVVHVEGSSYRRPGARMLVTENGELTGAISGGCLEGDALRKALLAINQRQNKLVTYDTNEEDPMLGVQLGCNGVVHLLFEPIQTNETYNPVYFLEKLNNERKDAILVTLFSFDRRNLKYGTSFFYRDRKIQSNLPPALKARLTHAVEKAFQDRISYPVEFDYETDAMNAYIEFIEPPIALVVAGAGNDAKPLAATAALMGWHTTIIDGRATHATESRFPFADKIIIGKASSILSQVSVDRKTAFVLMTHNYNYDLDTLEALLKITVNYIGILGPQKKYNRMLEELASKNIYPTQLQRSSIYAPVGLDLGAETAEEIGASVIAEILSVLNKGSASFLKDKAGPIHEHILLASDNV